MNGHHRHAFSEPYEGFVVCDIREIRGLPKRGLKKIYPVMKLMGNGKNDMATTCCSYSLVNDKFIPKDKRSETRFENISVKDGLGITIDVIVKQTLGKKTIGSVEIDIVDILMSGGALKEMSFPVKPAGECVVRVEVSPPPSGKTPNFLDDANALVSPLGQQPHANGFESSSSPDEKGPAPTPSPLPEDKDAEVPTPSRAPAVQHSPPDETESRPQCNA